MSPPGASSPKGMWVICWGAFLILVFGSLLFNVIFANYSLFSGLASLQKGLHHAAHSSISNIDRRGENGAPLQPVFNEKPDYPLGTDDVNKLKGERDVAVSEVQELKERIANLEASFSKVVSLNGGALPVTPTESPQPAAPVAQPKPALAANVSDVAVFTDKPVYPAPNTAASASHTIVEPAGRLQTGGGDIKWAKDDTLPEGGRRIFIDLGANCGNSYNALKDSSGKTNYDIAYLWEFNPQLVRAYLRPLEAIDPVVRIVPFPAWGTDTNMTFYIDKRDDKMTDEEVVKRYPCTSKRVNTRNTPADSSTFLADQSFHRAGRPMIVQAVGFPGWFRRQGFTKKDRVHLKVDIEGAECSVLDALMDEGMLCEVTKVMVEWHARMSPATAKCNTVTRERVIATAAQCENTEYRKWRR